MRMVEKAMEFVSELEGSEKEALINTLRDITEGKVSTPSIFSEKMEKKLISEDEIDLSGSSKSTYHSTTRNDPRKRRKDERSE